MDILREANGQSLLALIVDDNYKETLELIDENNITYEFEKMWYKPYREATYCILKQKCEGDNAIDKCYVFYFYKQDTELVLRQVLTEKKRQQIIKEFTESYTKQILIQTQQTLAQQFKQTEPPKKEKPKNKTNNVAAPSKNNAATPPQNANIEYIQPTVSENGKKGIFVGIVIIYALCLIFGILLVCVPAIQELPCKIGICEEISTQAYSITIGTMWLALIPSIGYYFATISPFVKERKKKIAFAVITTILLILTTAAFFLVIYLAKIEDLIEIRYFFKNDDYWFIPVSMVFATVGIMVCYALLFIKIDPEKIKANKPQWTTENVLKMVICIFKGLIYGVVTLIRLILTFKEKKPDLFILLATLLLTLLAFFASFIFSIICIAIIIVALLMVAAGYARMYVWFNSSSQKVVRKVTTVNGKTLTLTSDAPGSPQEYNDEFGVKYYSDDDGKTFYQK